MPEFLAKTRLNSAIIATKILGGVMKALPLIGPALSIFLSTLAVAQGAPGVANVGGSDPELTRPSIVLSGKVVMDDGTTIPGAAVQTLCRGQRRTVAHTDARGEFSFALVEHRSELSSMGVSDASVSGREGLPVGDSPSPLVNAREWRACAVQAEMPGFTSETVDIISRTDNRGGNIGSIKLHRLSAAQGLTISATSAAAPEPARKELEKGYEEEKKSDWDVALQSFQKATDLYPQYAVAWFELGRIKLLKGQTAEAKQAFNKSMQMDPQYVNPYLGLAQAAFQAQNWQETADWTAKVLAMNSVNFPNTWFLNGYANYNLGKIADAEKSAREGLKADPEHHFPRLEYLLGMALMQRKDYAGANEHLQNFLHAVKSPGEIDEAKKELEEIAKLSANTSAAADKK
jgi:tetratricopeptide (TPR) repeat protein